MPSPSPPSPSRPLSESLIGTWELVSREDHSSSGKRRIDPGLGENPIAILIYDRSGHFAAQFMKRDRGLVVETEVAPAKRRTTVVRKAGTTPTSVSTRSTTWAALSPPSSR